MRKNKRGKIIDPLLRYLIPQFVGMGVNLTVKQDGQFTVKVKKATKKA
jgi:hypothetical protein